MTEGCLSAKHWIRNLLATNVANVNAEFTSSFLILMQYFFQTEINSIMYLKPIKLTH